MIKVKVIAVNSYLTSEPNQEDKELAPIENLIAQVGYQNIKDIRVQSTNSGLGYYHIIYEDNLPYTPRPIPEKKGLFG